MIPSIVTSSGTITASVNGRSYTVSRDHVNYSRVKAALIAGDESAFITAADIPKAVDDFTSNDVSVVDGRVLYKGTELHGVIADRLLTLIREGFPYEPLKKFIANLQKNPSKHSVDELYTFLESHGLPITEDGCFLGYKAVRNDYTDKYTGKFSNTIGTSWRVERNTVDDNWRVACSSGFHVGNIAYVSRFVDSDGRVMIVKVDPADVVAVNTESDGQTKLRTCSYTVVGEYDVSLLKSGVGLSSPVHTSEGNAVSGYGGYGAEEYDDDDDDDYDDELDENDDY